MYSFAPRILALGAKEYIRPQPPREWTSRYFADRRPRGEALPFGTSGEPPAMKNGMFRVAGWPWLPGIGLAVTGSGSLNRQPALQNTTTSPTSGPHRSHGLVCTWVASTPGTVAASVRIRATADAFSESVADRYTDPDTNIFADTRAAGE